MDFKLKAFDELTVKELYSILQLRNEVFVVEQNCAYQDLDGYDQEALHLFGYTDSGLISYARILKPGMYYHEAGIGRVVVSPDQRGNAHGRALIKKAVEECRKAFHAETILISAQQYLERFYNSLGFKTESDSYLEDNIPHIKMRWAKN
ncbi:MAG: GNAT family N-acetyltransferase [Bacteroidetes bacterium]|nr:GNAT family N-acetyltransferase [Bacteroidota bacterium]